MKYSVDPDIKRAETLPGSFYSDFAVFDELKKKVFFHTWHWIGDDHLVPQSNSHYPLDLYPHFMDESILITRDASDEICALSNVCTHRGNIIAGLPGKGKSLVCGYHGRKFGLDGKYQSMPEFKEAEDFPRPCDDLHRFPVINWHGLLWVGFDPAFDLVKVLAEVDRRVGFLPIDQFRKDDSLSKDYLVNAHWSLYCDNYLEGFHIPFVHADLNAALDYGSYETLLFDHMNVQIGYSSGAEEVFDLPVDHIDYGKQVAAYYFWIFPNLMLNFYPWGLSVNLIQPIDMEKTKVSFITYIYDESKLGKGAGALLDKVEREDEFVVENVHKGLKSHYYTSGRFSPSREKGVHQFHRLLSQYIG